MNKEKARISRAEELNYGVHDEASRIVREHAAAINEHRPSPYSFEEANRAYNLLQIRVNHRDIIDKALSEGKPVPKDILSEYPDLVEKYKPRKVDG